MKIATLPLLSFLLCVLIIMPANAETIPLKGCIYNKNTGLKVQSPYIVRVWTKDGLPLIKGNSTGCYSGLAINTSQEWDFIEVILKKNGRFYTQQYRIPPSNLDMGMDMLGVQDGAARYDFYLDIIE